LRITGLIGSLRKDSFHKKIFETYQELCKDQFELVEGPISEIPLYNQDVQAKGFPSAVQELGQLIQSSAGILFFSPEYNYSIPGVLKNAIDWISRLENNPMGGKASSIISGSPGRLGGSRMQYHLRQVGIFMDLHFLNRPEIMLSEMNGLFNEHGQLSDQATIERLKKHAEIFFEFTKARL
jgi:chromate reductase, NAD(P)H dehydrogenase (quinone)